MGLVWHCEHLTGEKRAGRSGIARTVLFLRTSSKILKILPSITSKIGATLKGENLLPTGSKFFPLRVAPILEAMR